METGLIEADKEEMQLQIRKPKIVSLYTPADFMLVVY